MAGPHDNSVYPDRTHCSKQDEEPAITQILVVQKLAKILPDTTWMRLNTVASDSVHSSTKLKKSRSMWNGVQQIANTKTKTTEKE